MRVPNPTARFGETIASNYLTKKGYKIIERNYRKGYGEIDIIAIHKNILVFLEVKTRTTLLFGGAIESISEYKLRSLIKTARYYRLLHPNLPEMLRIDAVLIDLTAGKIKNINHIENITDF